MMIARFVLILTESDRKVLENTRNSPWKGEYQNNLNNLNTSDHPHSVHGYQELGNLKLFTLNI